MKLDTTLDWLGKDLSTGEALSCGCSEAEYALLWELVVNGPHPKNGVIVEVGSWLGASTLTLASAAQERGLHVISIDPFSLGTFPSGRIEGTYPQIPNESIHPILTGKDEYWLFRANNDRLVHAGLKPLVTQVIGDSIEVMKHIAVFDVAFLWIDGDHAYPHAYQEWIGLGRNMVSGGVVALHDSQEEGLQKCFAELAGLGIFTNYDEIPLPALHSAPTRRENSTVDHVGPWWTRAWRRK